MFKKPVIVAAAVNIKGIGCGDWFDAGKEMLHSLCERVRNELAAAVVTHFWRFSKPDTPQLRPCRAKFFKTWAHLGVTLLSRRAQGKLAGLFFCWRTDLLS